MNYLNNALNINDNTSYCKENNLCIICKQNIQCAPTYTTSKCKHTFHTHCIVTWYRTTQYGCPSCGHKSSDIQKYRSRRNCYLGYLYSEIINKKLTLYKKLSNKHPELFFLKTHMNKLEELKILAKKEQQCRIHWVKHIKEKKLNYADGIKYRNSMFRNRWTAMNTLNKYKLKIVNLPITPIIIPQFIDLT